MREVVEKIKEFYKPKLDNWLRFTYILETPKGEKYLSFKSDRKIYLTFGQDINGDPRNLSRKELEEKGIVALSERELGKLLFPEHYEEIRPKIEPDNRMQKYLEGIKRGIGLIKIAHGYDEEDFVPVKRYKIWHNLTGSGYVDVGRIDDKLWVAQYSYRTSIDDYDVVRMYFNKFPSKKDIRTAATIEDIETYFSFNGWDKANFYCWECGLERHFCDIKASTLEQKYDYFLNNYCGCDEP
ncbi:hypothetical protein [Anaerocellum danielii]|uniref:Uncharacterized protein n=1 Tax=Anaerocellum danielii TaxID=1387557 RepID=A0ABZ0TXG5_9FIRM|nr:hypothetical protein [Caldicellulosiruptor danielii]WPX08136.1 hypothetical protein SOJ16_002000 [Caldicellulosiruptor danielii]